MVKDSELPVRKMVSLTAEQAKSVDDYRFNNRIKSEAEALRRIIDAGLKALKGKRK